MKIFFFGYGTQAGHYLFKPGLRHAGRDQNTPWGPTPDFRLVPHDVDCRFLRGLSSFCDCPQLEGVAAIHHKDGWTAIGFCDRSVDSRGGCNGNFLVEAPGLTLEQMLDLARQHFPTVMSRFKFPIVLKRPLETPLAASNYRDALPSELFEAARRVHLRMHGTLASDIWESPGHGHDEKAEWRDYELIAIQWKWLHPGSTMDPSDAAECWVRDFDDLFIN